MPERLGLEQTWRRLISTDWFGHLVMAGL